MRLSNNKRIGTEFEQEMVDFLAADGWWVHFITPNAAGAQPFDIIAVRRGVAIAIDCKTVVRGSVPYSRLEDNQKTAMELWMRCGNTIPLIAVKYNDTIYKVPYPALKAAGSIRLTEDLQWQRDGNG